MVKESKYCSFVMKKHFNKELVMTDDENVESLKKCWICEKDDVKVTDHCYVFGKNRTD